jgi:hypothetical protein
MTNGVDVTHRQIAMLRETFRRDDKNKASDVPGAAVCGMMVGTPFIARI